MLSGLAGWFTKLTVFPACHRLTMRGEDTHILEALPFLRSARLRPSCQAQESNLLYPAYGAGVEAVSPAWHNLAAS